MAGNMIVLNSKFNPYSFDEMLKPLQIYGQEYKAQEEERSKFETLSAQWKNKLNKNLDTKAYTQYEGYMNKLQQQASDLATNGLTPMGRKGILEARSGYTSDIIPIEEAYAARTKKSEEQSQQKQKDNSITFEKDFSKFSIDDFMGNPTLTSKYASGRDVRADVALQAKQFADQMQNNPTLSSATHGFLREMNKGLVTSDMIQSIINNPNSNPELKGVVKQLQGIMQSAITTSGVNEWGTQEQKGLITTEASKGLWEALGTDKTSLHYDQLAAENRQIKRDATPPPVEEKVKSWENVGDKVDASNSSIVKDLTEDMKVLKELKAMTPEERKKSMALTSRADRVREDFSVEALRKKYPKMSQKELEQTSAIKTKSSHYSDPFDKGVIGSMRSNNKYNKAYTKYYEKYGTNNLDEIQRRMEKDILQSTSLNRTSAIKLNDNSVLNSYLSNQLMSGITLGGMKDRISTIEGKEVKQEDFAKIFDGNGKLGYNAQEDKLTMFNPGSPDMNYTLNKGVLASISIYDKRTGSVPIDGTTYLKALQDEYKKDPESTTTNIMLNTLYDNLDVYGRTGKTAPATTSSKSNIQTF